LTEPPRALAVIPGPQVILLHSSIELLAGVEQRGQSRTNN
jgi:hypothetical protein